MIIWILLVGLPIVIGLIAQARVSSVFGEWKHVPASSNRTGAEVARAILDAANIRDVEVISIRDLLGDHYDPKNKRLCLSPDVYSGASVAALGIAAHECGHAIQDASAYAPLKTRMALVPVTGIASQLLFPIMLASMFFHLFPLLYLAIICFAILSIFQLVTLPVEFDASRRAKVILTHCNFILPGKEANGVNAVLNAAALTYVAAFIASVGNLIYFLLPRNE